MFHTITSIIPDEFKDVDEFFEKSIKNLVALFLEELDKWLSLFYSKEGYKVIRTKKRKIKILFNSHALEISFSYRVLKSPKTKEKIKPLIDFLKLKRRDIYTSKLKKEAVKLATKMTFSEASSSIGASAMSVWNWLQLNEIKEEEVHSYAGKSSEVRCESDGMFIAVRENKRKEEIKVGIVYDSKEMTGKNGNRMRNRLVNKQIILSYPNEFSRYFSAQIHSRSSYTSVIYYSSDMGENPREAAPDVGFTDRFIDLFHLVRMERMQGKGRRSEELDKSIEYKGYFGSCESNVKKVKQRLRGRSWSRKGLLHMIRNMMVFLNSLDVLKVHEVNEQKSVKPVVSHFGFADCSLVTTNDNYLKNKFKKLLNPYFT